MSVKQLAQFALSHGFKTALFSTFVLVWDADGSCVATDLHGLKAWMGY